MPVVIMPDGTPVNMPDKISPEQAARLKELQSKAPKEQSFSERHPVISGIAKGAANWAGDVVGGTLDMVGGSIAPGMSNTSPEDAGAAVGEKAFDAGKQVLTRPLAETGQKIASAAKDSVSTPEKATGTVLDVASLLVPGIGGERIASGASRLGEAAESAVSKVKALRGTEAERATSAVRKAMPEKTAHHEVAVKASGLPPSEGFDTPEGHGIEAAATAKADETLSTLLSAKKAVVDPSWDLFRIRGSELEAQNKFFPVSQPKFYERLQEIKKGGKGKTTEFSGDFQADAAKLEDALSGTTVDGVHRPVDLNVVHEEYRKLRAKENNVGPQGYDAEVRKRYGTLADELGDALRDWVGPEYFPDKIHADMSKDINKWGSKLGQRLAGRQDLEYVPHDQSPQAFQGVKSNEIFKNQHTVEEARGLLGDIAVKDLAGKYVSNNMRRRTSE